MCRHATRMYFAQQRVWGRPGGLRFPVPPHGRYRPSAMPSTPAAVVGTPGGTAMTVHDRPFGRYLEDFVPGDIYRHWPGKTITE